MPDIDLINQLIGIRVREERKNAGLTQQDLADEVGAMPHHMSLIEAGRRGISFAQLYRIALALRVEPGNLLAPLEQLESFDWSGEDRKPRRAIPAPGSNTPAETAS